MGTKQNAGGAQVPCILLFGTWLALTASHFIYQVFTDGSWVTAASRSYFQLLAFVALWFTQRIMRPNSA